LVRLHVHYRRDPLHREPGPLERLVGNIFRGHEDPSGSRSMLARPCRVGNNACSRAVQFN
jgi:hypothetical protein